MKRVVVAFILFLSIYLLPWWLTFFAICVSFLFFDLFVEGVVLALMLDWLYSPNFYLFSNFYPAPILALVLCIFVPVIKRRLLI